MSKKCNTIFIRGHGHVIMLICLAKDTPCIQVSFIALNVWVWPCFVNEPSGSFGFDMTKMCEDSGLSRFT